MWTSEYTTYSLCWFGGPPDIGAITFTKSPLLIPPNDDDFALASPWAIMELAEWVRQKLLIYECKYSVPMALSVVIVNPHADNNNMLPLLHGIALQTNQCLEWVNKWMDRWMYVWIDDPIRHAITLFHSYSFAYVWLIHTLIHSVSKSVIHFIHLFVWSVGLKSFAFEPCFVTVFGGLVSCVRSINETRYILLCISSHLHVNMDHLHLHMPPHI